ncbi:MAG TPA: tyrosine-type recombinase/integrase [Thermoanaerobaculia bacterium]|nr:tyrosine-type recombinase/integrase [Thermoanaerobaculia bacterium]
MNVREAIESFLTHGQTVRNLSDRTLRAYQSDLQQFTRHVNAAEMVNITHADLETYIDELGTGPYRDTSIRRKVAAIKVFFRYLEDHGVVPESPARMLKIKRPVESRVPVVLSRREVTMLLTAPKKQIERLESHRERSQGGRNRYFCAVRDNVIIELLFSTGIRIGELVALDVHDVDLSGRFLRITGRTTRARMIPISSDELLATLEAYIHHRSERDLETSALFVGRSGTRLTIYSIENIFKKHVRIAEIKRHITPHALRHTMAAMLIDSGADIRDVQEMLGHASILSTQVYTRLPSIKKRIARDRNASTRIAAAQAELSRLPIKRR